MSGTSGSIDLGGGGVVVTAALPLADGVNDTQRTGAVGVSPDAARADHIHPIVRLAQVTLPDPAIGGGTFQGQVIWNQYTTEETQEFAIRVQMTPTAAGTWRTITFPNLPGYQLIEASIGNAYVPGVLGTNPWVGQNFVWGVTTFYWSTPAAYVNQTCYFNFFLRYVLN
jgi:hypothetical protein